MEQTFAPARTAGRRRDACAPAVAVVELWLADSGVATQPAWIETHSAWLTSEERERLARFTRPQRRAQFLAGHILLRRVVAACWCIDPRDVRVATRADGSPEVLVPAGVQCSLAHTGRWVAALVQPAEADDCRPGVDIESMRSDRPIEAIVKLACGIDAVSREQAYRAWAQHEAQIKAAAGAPPFVTTWEGHALAVCAGGRPRSAVVDLAAPDHRTPLDLIWTDGLAWPAASRADGR